MPQEFPQANSTNRLVSSKRILVLGSSGSGKTFLSLRLGQALGIEPIHLDMQFWKPGWVPTPREEWRKTVSSLVAKQSWIMDGTYESTLDLRLPTCDAIIRGMNNSMSKLTMVPWKAGSATPTTVRG